MSDCVNTGNVSGNTQIGGLIGTFNQTISTVLTLTKCTNNGNVSGGVTINDKCIGGFVGYISGNSNLSVTVYESESNGNVQGSSAVGGFLGSMDSNDNLSATISNTISRGFMKATNEKVGGFIGQIWSCPNMAMTITSSTSSVIIDNGKDCGGFIGSLSSKNTTVFFSECIYDGSITVGNNAGGFVGYINSNYNVRMSLSYCVCTGSVTGSNVAGFIGLIFSYSGPNYLFVLDITNSISEGSIQASKTTCGMFCVDSKCNYNVNTTVYNSINKGMVQGTSSSAAAYGITNNITTARNVVSMGSVIGSSESCSFWKVSNDVEMFYGLKTECKKCEEDGATVFERNTTNGLYTVIGSGERVDEKLNKQAKMEKYSAMWTYDLSLSTKYVSVTAGKPVNGQVLVDSVNPLDKLVDLCSVFMGQCTIVNQQTKKPIQEPSLITDGISVSFCFNVSVIVNGVVEKSLFVEFNTQMKDIDGLSSYFTQQYEVKNADTGVLYNPSSVVDNHVKILVVKKHRVTIGKPLDVVVYVRTGGTLNTIQQEYGYTFDDYVVVNKETGVVFAKTTVISTDIELTLCHTVAVSGAFNASYIVEHDSHLGDIKELDSFWDNKYSVVDQIDKNQIYTNMTPVTHDISMVVIKNARVIIEIDPIDDVNETDVINAITDIIGVDPGHMTVDVVRNDKGQVTEITLIVDEAIAAEVVDSINSVDTSNNCEAGVLCRRKQAYMDGGAQSVSANHFLWFPALSFLSITFVNLL